MTGKSRLFALVSAVLSGWVLLGACASSESDSKPGGSGGVGGGGGSGGSATGATGGIQLDSTAGQGGSDAPFPVDAGCVIDSSKAVPIPLDIFVMMDQSGSMLQDAGNQLSRWQTVKAALTSFVQQPDVAGIGIGIQFFGLPQPDVTGCITQSCKTDTDCTGGCTLCMPQGLCQSTFNPDIDSCDAIDYAWADVPIQPLPSNGSTIISAMSAHTPGTNTPTLPALEGALLYAKAWAKAHTDHITIVAFATDGLPSECNTDPAAIDAVAAAGVTTQPSVRTFVIGVGPALQALDQVAASGGSTTAYHVDVDPKATELFLGAMNKIRLAGLACSYKIPSPPPGKQLNFNQVNVSYTPGKGDPSATLPKVLSSADCPATGDAWYYDSEIAPTKIILCKSSCDVVSNDLNAQIDIVLGCQTVVIPK